MILSPLAGQGVGLDPGAGAGEGEAVCTGSMRNVPPASTRGQPCLCVAMSSVGKVGEGAETASIGVEKLRRSSADTASGTSARYQDH